MYSDGKESWNFKVVKKLSIVAYVHNFSTVGMKVGGL